MEHFAKSEPSSHNNQASFGFARRFDGVAYDPKQDGERLSHQLDRIRDLMLDGQWRTLREIASLTKSPEASVSAQLRNLRKPRFGGYTVERQRVAGGLWGYRVACSENVTSNTFSCSATETRVACPSAQLAPKEENNA